MFKLKYLLRITLMVLGVICVLNPSYSQVSITSSTSIVENFNTFTSPSAGTSVTTLNSPTNWTLTATGNTWRGNGQTTGSSGGWYANNNLSFLGSGSSSNGQATWLLQNNSGSNITGFTLQFTGRLWKTGTSSPNVTVSWSNSATSTNPTVGALTNSLSSCTFNDATTNISTGATLSQSVSGLSIANGQYIFIRFIHSGATNSDNLGWDNVTFTPTITSPATISSTGTLSAFTTTYGSVSNYQSFNVSGSNMQAGITITPPVGFEVSTSTTFTSVGTNSSPIVLGSSGTISSTTIYVRLTQTAIPGNYNSQNIVLSSTNASNVNVSTTTSGNTVSQKQLTISSAAAQNKTYDGTNSAVITGTLSGVVGSDVVTFTGAGQFATINVGTGISVTSNCTLSGAQSSYYTLSQPTGLSADILKANQIITFRPIPYKSNTDSDFTVLVSSSSGLPITLTSSNTSVATIVSGQIHIVGIGNTTITASQLGDSNYNSASPVGQALNVSQLISGWSFELSTTTNTGCNAIINSGPADLGLQTVFSNFSAYHSNCSSVWSNPVGNGSSKSVSSNNWSVNDFYSFRVKTSSFDSIKVQFDVTGSNTGPKDFKIQWSIDSINFYDVSSFVIPYNTSSNTNISWTSTSYNQLSTVKFDLGTIPSVSFSNVVYFKILNMSTNSISGGTVSSSGTSRIDNFSVFGLYFSLLPIELLSWNGYAKDDKIFLNWSTASQTNNEKFIIEKVIINEELNTLSFSEIGEVQGAGNSNQVLHYTFVDYTPNYGVNYYRLKQVDFDGQYETFKIIAVNSKINKPENIKPIYYDFFGREVIKPEPYRIYLRLTGDIMEKVIIHE